MTYFDTSALIKRFVEEEGSVLVASLIDQGDAVATLSRSTPIQKE